MSRRELAQQQRVHTDLQETPSISVRFSNVVFRGRTDKCRRDLKTNTMLGYSPASHYKGLSVQSHFCPRVNSGGQIGNGAGSSLSTSAFSCNYHSTNVHLPHFTHLLLKPNNFIKVVKQNNSLSIILDHIVMSTTYLIIIK
jgi:hypothetical protein